MALGSTIVRLIRSCGTIIKCSALIRLAKKPTAVIIGLAVMTLLLIGSVHNAASPSNTTPPDSVELLLLKKQGVRLFAEGHYLEARKSFQAATLLGERDGNYEAAVRNRLNGANCSFLLMRYGEALLEFEKAKIEALRFGRKNLLLGAILNSIAALYLHIGQPAKALEIVYQALPGAEGTKGPTHGLLLYNAGGALIDLGRIDESIPVLLESLNEFLDHGDVENAVIALAALGKEAVAKQHIDIAEWALNEGFRLARCHRVFLSAALLRNLAEVRHQRGDDQSASVLFDEAVTSRPGLTPRYTVLAERGQFRLSIRDLHGAVADFRAARQLAADMRADMVPADEDRVAFESALSVILEGFIESGNRLASQTGDRATLEATFDAAEQDRLWSLRALIPAANDWRTKLTPRYWEILAGYQSLVRTAPKPASDARKKTDALRQQLQKLEMDAAGKSTVAKVEAPLAHVRQVLGNDTVLFSFRITKTSSWLWAIDRNHMQAVELCPVRQLESEVAALRRALSEGLPAAAEEPGRKLYQELFGRVPKSFLALKHWRLEPDGPLYELPFAALVTNTGGPPAYLIEHADLESLPGALLAERGAIPQYGAFLGIGDPIYSVADERYRGERPKSAESLPRLPNTATELQACERAWGAAGSRVLTGPDAAIAPVRTALKANPAILHFATHVVAQNDEFQSGVIALGLDSAGVMGLLGPREIVARGLSPRLVVMNGCHSAQGQALPGSGLMGLTRAWIGAGAMAVMATQWDIPDDASQSLMTGFYRALRAAPERGWRSPCKQLSVTLFSTPLCAACPETGRAISS